MSLSTPEAVERWERRFAYLPLGLLAVATPVALATGGITESITPTWRLIAQLALVVVVAGWIWWWTFAHVEWREDLTRMRVYYVGRVVLALALTVLNPLFCIFAWVGFVDAYDYFRGRARSAALAITAVAVAVGQVGGMPPETAWQGWLFVGLVLLNFTLASVFGAYSARLWESHEERAEVIAELERVNADLERVNVDLERALAENAELHETVVVQARSAGVQEERRRLAREIHDTIAQSLAGVIVQLQAAAERADPDDVRRRIDRATDQAREALAEARRSVLDLAPVPLTGRSLADAVTDLVGGFGQEHGIQADAVVTGKPRPLHPEVEATVLRVAQEALSNVGKHAAADRVGVTLSFDETEVILDVRDDGVGFDLGRPKKPTSFGLRGMRQRAERLAGELDIETADGAGTAVSVRLPTLARGAA